MTEALGVHTLQLGKEWFSEQSGGLNRYYAELVRRLPEVGVGVTGLVAGSDEVTRRSGGCVRAFAPRQASLPVRLAGVRAHARRALSEQPDDLVAAHFALYTAPCLDLVRGRPMVVHFHGPWAAESRSEGAAAWTVRMKHWVEHRVYQHATRFIVLSKAFGEVLADGHAVPTDRIRVVPGGVDTRRFALTHSRAEARQLLGWPTDRPIALVVRRLVRRMGLENLIASIADVRREVPDLLLMIAGTGPLTGELNRRIRDANLDDAVRLVGFVPDQQLPLAYQAADVSVVPSVALEGFGLIVAESLAAGTPVLVTAVGGLPETLAGFAPQCVIHEPGARGLAATLVAALRGTMPIPSRDECVQYARDRFDWSVVASQVRGVYKEVAP